MLRDTAVRTIADRLGNRTDLDARILTEMQFVQENILEGEPTFKPWFLLSEIASCASVAGEPRLVLPTDFLWEYEDGALWRYDAADAAQPWKPIVRKDFGWLTVSNPVPGLPKYYALAGEYYRLGPIPDAVYSFKLLYYAKDASLSTGNIENKWLKYASDWMIGETGMILAEFISDNDAFEKFALDAKKAKNRLHVAEIARQQTNRSLEMGDPD